MNKREYTWYVEPMDDQTNATISGHVIEKSTIAECVAVKCVDNERRNLWRCNFDFVKLLHASKESLNLRFRIYNQADKGPIRRCPSFLFRKKKKRKAELKPVC